jgi:hypothetical protein
VRDPTHPCDPIRASASGAVYVRVITDFYSSGGGNFSDLELKFEQCSGAKNYESVGHFCPLWVLLRAQQALIQIKMAIRGRL